MSTLSQSRVRLNDGSGSRNASFVRRRGSPEWRLSMLTTGVDLVDISRVERVLARHGERFLARVFTPAEVARCRGVVSELAVRFAAKEAVSKALGVGLRVLSPKGVGFHEVEVLSDSLGKPYLRLSGRAAELATEAGLREWAVSLSHEKSLAIAFVVAQ